MTGKESSLIRRMIGSGGDDRAVATRTAGLLFLVGAVLIAVTVALPPAARGSDLLILGLGGIAAVTGIVLIAQRRVSELVLGVALALGTTLITAATLEAGPGRGTDDNEVLYLWVVAYAFWFLRFPHALAQLALIGVADALLLANEGSFDSSAVTRWLVTVSTFLVLGLLFTWMRRTLERRREEKVRLAVMAERMRIARDLHDATGHGVSVMSIQAAAALNTLQSDPDAARDALEAIKRTSRDTAEDMRTLLEVLREREPTADELGRPSLARLDRLADRSREAGMPVEVKVRGIPTALPSGLDQAAYRVAEEALASLRRQAGPGAGARLTVEYGPGLVDVEVLGDGSGGGGIGPPLDAQDLAGMRERVAAFGGDLEAGVQDGGFRVYARFKLRRRAEDRARLPDAP